MGPKSQASEIEAALREHVCSRYAGGRALEPEDDLLGSGVVDSMGVYELSSFIEERFGVTVQNDDVVPDNFRSLGAMTRYVAARKGIEVVDPFAAAIRALVVDAVPRDGVVLVVSHGDNALLSLDGRTGWHFPRDENGDHSYNPADGADAIRQIYALRLQGATHIVFPSMELWWLDEYAGLRDYLESDFGEVARSEAGVLYSLPRDRA